MTLSTDVVATLQPGFPGTDVPDWLVAAHTEGLVSVCLYGDNVASAEGLAGADGLAALCRTLHERMPGVLLAVDEEGGDVTRLHYPTGSPAVGNAVLGRLDDMATTTSVAASIGGELTAYGIGLDLAPVVDVNSSPDNPVIGVRSFGADPVAVGRHGAAWVAGLQSTGVAACAKHFPGHGDTVVDSHHGLPHVDVPLEVLRERELAPFRAAVAAGVAAVMTSHVVVEALDPVRPATFSPDVIGMLRDELGFTGRRRQRRPRHGRGERRDGHPGGRRAGTRRRGRPPLPRTSAPPPTCMPRCTPRSSRPCAPAGSPPSGWARLLPGCVGSRRGRRLGSRRARRRASPPAPRPSRRSCRPRSSPGRSGSGTRPVHGSLRRAPSSWSRRRPSPAQRWATSPGVRRRWGRPWRRARSRRGRGSRSSGRGLTEGHPARAVAARLRAAGHDVVLVECGWPRGGADIETFGGSPVVARALLAVLRGEVGP